MLKCRVLILTGNYLTKQYIFHFLNKDGVENINVSEIFNDPCLYNDTALF